MQRCERLDGNSQGITRLGDPGLFLLQGRLQFHMSCPRFPSNPLKINTIIEENLKGQLTWSPRPWDPSIFSVEPDV